MARYSSSRLSHKRRPTGWLKLILVLLIAGAGFGLYRMQADGGSLNLPEGAPSLAAFLDFTDPTLELQAPVRGIGADPFEIKFKASDVSSGLHSMTVSITQGEKTTEVLNRTLGGPNEKDAEIAVPIDGRRLELTEGDALLKASVRDAALWSNVSHFEQRVEVSFVRPRVEVLTTQHNATVGGTELVVFRFIGRTMEEGGVQAGSVQYPAIPVEKFVDVEGDWKGLYIGLFPLPYDFDPDSNAIRVFGRDDFGNTATSSFYYKIAKKKFSTVDMKLSEGFLNTKVPELLDVYRRQKPDAEITGNHAQDFRLINEELRKLNEEVIQSSLRKSDVDKRMWRGAFIRPLAAAPKASFAERRHYKSQSETVSQSLHMGIDLADVVQAKVTAANHGRVVFAGELGIYGLNVIIDHGAGVSSLYGHLSSISVKEGQDVQQGEEIARTGATGLAGGDHLHFEIRVHGVPVSPIEWWDPQWIKEHIEGKVSGVLSAPTAGVKAG